MRSCELGQRYMQKSIRIHRPNRRKIRSSNHLPLLVKKIYSINTCYLVIKANNERKKGIK